MAEPEGYDHPLLTKLLGEAAASASLEYTQGVDFSKLDGTSDLVEDMLKGKKLDTRVFLRPIYKLCKHMTISSDENNPTVPRTSECWIPFQTPLERRDPSIEAERAALRWKQHINFAASLAIAEWLIQLSTVGDEQLGIAVQAHLQPVYAFNTIITMAQRASAAIEARATYGRICFHNLSPDVFSLTALIDVFGRAHECSGAFWLFKRMQQVHGLVPNVVTCVTAARVSIVHRDDGFFKAVLDQLLALYDQVTKVSLEKASSDYLTSLSSSSAAGGTKSQSMPIDQGDTDVSLDSVKRMCSIVIMSSFECSIGAERFDLAEQVLTLARRRLDVAPSKEALVNVLRDLYFDFFDSNLKSVLENFMLKWEQENIIPPHTLSTLQNSKNSPLVENAASSSVSTHGHRESLGKNSPSDLRREVVEHDLSRLEFRIQVGGVVSKEDYETLIHQCRKRKWCAEVRLILTEMKRLSISNPRLHPDAATACVAVDAYVDSGQSDRALQLLQSIHLSTGTTKLHQTNSVNMDMATADDIDLSEDSFETDGRMYGWCDCRSAELGGAYLAVCRGAAREGNAKLVYETASNWLNRLDMSNMLDEGNNGNNRSEDEVKKEQITSDMLAGCMRALGLNPIIAFQLLEQWYMSKQQQQQQELDNSLSEEKEVAAKNYQLSKLVSLLIQSSSILAKDDNTAVVFIMDKLSVQYDQIKQHQASLPMPPNIYHVVQRCVNKYMGCFPPLCISVLMSSAAVAVVQSNSSPTFDRNEPIQSAVQLAFSFTLDQFINRSNPSITVLSKLPMFSNILLEAFGRCPKAVVMTKDSQPVKTRKNKRKKLDETAAAAAPSGEDGKPNPTNDEKEVEESKESLPFNSFLRPNLLSSIHKRVIWLQRVFELMLQHNNLPLVFNAVVQKHTYNNNEKMVDNDERDVCFEKVGGIEEEEDADGEGSTAFITRLAEGMTEDMTLRLKQWEGYFEPIMTNAWQWESEIPNKTSTESCGKTQRHKQEQNDSNGLDAGMRDEYLLSVSKGEFIHSELGALLRLQRIYVRSLLIKDKQDRVCLQQDLKLVYQQKFHADDSHSSNSALLTCSLLYLNSTYLMLPDKMQRKLAKYMFEAVQDICGVLPLNQIALELKPCSIEILKEFHKSLLVPFLESLSNLDQNISNSEHVSQDLVVCIECLFVVMKHALDILRSKREKLMKVATFLRDIRVQIDSACEDISMQASSSSSISIEVLKDNLNTTNQTVLLSLLDVVEVDRPTSAEDNGGGLAGGGGRSAYLSSTMQETQNSDGRRVLSSECLDCLVCYSEKGLEEKLVILLKEKGFIHVAAQLACKFALISRDKVFSDLVHESDRLNFATFNQCNQQHHQEISSFANNVNRNFLTLDDLGCDYCLVNDMESLMKASLVLRENGVRAVGVDAEWRPFSHRASTMVPVALLQISTTSHAFLFDLLRLESSSINEYYHDNTSSEVSISPSADCDIIPNLITDQTKASIVTQQQQQQQQAEGSSSCIELSSTTIACRELIHWIFSCNDLVKYGFGVKEDVRRLKESYGEDAYGRMQVLNLVDFRDDDRFKTGSLSSAISATMGKDLDKKMQTSDWAMRPLTEQQMQYAALDARCLLELVKRSER